ADDRSGGHGRNGARRNGSGGGEAVTDHGSARPDAGDHGASEPNVGDHSASGAVELLPVPGLPEFRPGDDLAAALADAAPWLRDHDVVVVTSKVVSKCEGRIGGPDRSGSTGCVTA